jgi:selenide, water dikinase
LTQLLAGVCSVLKAENCSLVGGHTSEGNDFAIGLSVNGYIEEGHQTAKGPPQDGDLLILTKPLGTGVILAADMRGEAKGEWVSGAIENMIFSNKLASNLLQSKEENFACSGCTDVTGFGLMGHLLEMMKYQPNSMLREEEEEEEEQGVEDGICTRPAGLANEGSVERLEVTIHLSEVPLLTGAVECVELGVLSSLHPQVSLSFFLSLSLPPSFSLSLSVSLSLPLSLSLSVSVSVSLSVPLSLSLPPSLFLSLSLSLSLSAHCSLIVTLRSAP